MNIGDKVRILPDVAPNYLAGKTANVMEIVGFTGCLIKLDEDHGEGSLAYFMDELELL